MAGITGLLHGVQCSAEDKTQGIVLISQAVYPTELYL